MSAWGLRWGGAWGNLWGTVTGVSVGSGLATSEAYEDDFRVSEIIDEAFERCGVDPADLVMRHLQSARRSFELMFSEWANRGVKLWAVDQKTQTLTAGTATYDCPQYTLGVLEMVVRRNGVDTPVHPMARDEYLNIPTKSTPGLPTKFYLNRQRVTPTITLWNVPENGTDTLIYYHMRRLQDVGNMVDGVDVPYRWLEAATAGLASKLAVKFAPDRLTYLKGMAEEQFQFAKEEDRERTDTQFTVQ